MKFTIVERKIKISDDLRDYSLRKVEKLDRYFQSDSAATITFSELRGRQTVEVTVNHNGMIFRAEETTTDMFASVDGAISSIERQIRKNKTRLEKRLREGAFAKGIPAPSEFAEEDFDVVRRKKFDVKPMSVDEAILQMNLLGHQFFFFKNSDDDNVHAVIYKRAAGGYGLIESE
ncbi:ribosome-associated translation inhibitor RaiA [Intestinibacillus massiliensis]|uniref:ribosome hibernation-promoting factor, HPF/YfiA family n=1 Tax=Intestinibacillus massiliensis TaxID=1871029 RepID=UPI000B357DD0|nr:ribosome-associated translation inhibitor RaiA [Intestinibacillus massiliensis]MCB6364759.1 ribosome-associated translation inhibitor RaiA [Intestinibacillus massiliensis]